MHLVHICFTAHLFIAGFFILHTCFCRCWSPWPRSTCSVLSFEGRCYLLIQIQIRISVTLTLFVTLTLTLPISNRNPNWPTLYRHRLYGQYHADALTSVCGLYGPYVRVHFWHPYVRAIDLCILVSKNAPVHTARLYGPYVRIITGAFFDGCGQNAGCGVTTDKMRGEVQGTARILPTYSVIAKAIARGQWALHGYCLWHWRLCS